MHSDIKHLRPEPVVTDEIMDLHERVLRLDILGFTESATAVRTMLRQKIEEANPHLRSEAA
jgi:hypothetical protein